MNNKHKDAGHSPFEKHFVDHLWPISWMIYNRNLILWSCAFLGIYLECNSRVVITIAKRL